MTNDPARLIAESARKFEDPAERAAYLDRVCRGIVRLRADVDRILAEPETRAAEPETQDAPPPTMQPVVLPATATDAAPPAGRTGEAPTRAAERDASAGPAGDPTVEHAGDRIGRYELVRQLGEGGFGTVWLADQFEPVQRSVALKIIKLGMNTVEVVTRFEQERQALALMDHPNVARVLDAGATAQGRPYFVMDFVQGEPIHHYCDREKLTIPQRLALFAEVCSAVHHAHMKGIIHRDLKPSNVLVGTRDGAPHPTVIDFGIAKATSARLTEKSHVTEQYQVIGTFQYMSPEQAQASPDIDTRTDVYSLGVMLYELLTGVTPFDQKTFERAGFIEIQRMIREDEPPRPSTKVTQSIETLADLAERRGTEPGRLGPSMRGELDWIVMKAIEKDRERRYDSAEGLGADIRRYLAGEDVEAVPPSAGYRFRKLMRRNRGLVAAVGGIAAALVVGVVGFAWQANIAQGERDLAVKAREAEEIQHREAEAQRDRARRAEEEANKRAAELELLADFQARTLEQIDPTEAGIGLTDDVIAKFRAALVRSGVPEAEREDQVRAFRREWSRVNATDTARDLIDRTIMKPAIATIDAKFKDQPVTDARLRHVLATHYEKLGFFAEAVPLLESALATRRRILGEEHRETLRSLCSRASLFHSQGNFDAAAETLRDCLEKQRRALGEDDEDTMKSLELHAVIVAERGDHAQAEKLARQVFEWRRKSLGETAEDTLGVYSTIASSLRGQHRNDEAEKTYLEGIAKARASLGDSSIVTLMLMNNLGTCYQGLNRLADAERIFREILDVRRRVSGEEHPNTLIAIGNLGFVLQAQGKFGDAEPLIEESLAKRRKVFGEDHMLTSFSVADLGALREAQGRIADAESCYRRALDIRRRAIGSDHALTQASLSQVAAALAKLGRGAEGAELLRTELDRSRVSVGADDPLTLRTANAYGGLLIGLGRNDAAIELFTEFLPRMVRVLGDTDTTTTDSTMGLCGSYTRSKRIDDALRVAREMLDRIQGHPEREAPMQADVLFVVSDALVSAERLTDAEALVREELRLRRRFAGERDPGTLNAMNRLGTSLQRQDDRAAEAEPHLRAAYDGRLATFGPDHPQTLVSVRNMWIVLDEIERYDEALVFLRRDLEHTRKAAGPDSQDALFLNGALARVLLNQGSLEEAEQVARETADATQRARGAMAPDSIETRAQLGSVLQRAGKFAEAVAVFEKLLPRIRVVAGKDHPRALELALDLAMSLRDAGRAKDAETLFEETLNRARKAGPDAAGVASMTTAEYARMLLAAGRRDDALALARRTIAAARKSGPQGGVQLAADLVVGGAILLDAGEPAEAEPALADAVTIRDKAAPALWSTFNARAMLGGALLGQKRYAEAEPLVIGGHEGLTARRRLIPPQAAHWLAKSRDRVLRLYEEWNAAEPGKGHDAKLAEWKAKLAPTK